MKSLLHPMARLSFFIIVLFAISCKKDAPLNDQNEEVYTVSFKFSGFSDKVSLLKSNDNYAVKLAATTGNSQNYAEGYLYYWSFNNDNLLPDIRFNNQLSPAISYANAEVPSTFVNSTYAYENFAAGKALTFAGAKDILIKMPIAGVIQVTGLGFDVGSPGTGPKDFEIFYSVDKGLVYTTLSINNQFGNTNTANQKHSYSYDLSDKSIQGEELWIKITPKAGERGTSGTFNENTGALRMDNLYLNGIAPTSSSNNSIEKIHYFLFNKEKSGEVISGMKDLNGENTLNLSLPIGEYQICFLTNSSNAELLFPSNISLESFYSSNVFSNAKADIFGYVGDLHVSKEQTNPIPLDRLFSQIKVEFTDVTGLAQVTKIVIDQVHDPFYFAPFNTNMTNPILDQSSIEISDDFASNKQIVFNQFMGRLTSLSPVKYDVHVYGSNGVLRTINLSSTLKNNMQLVFRGNLLENIEVNNSFSILKNENWDGQQTTDF